MVRGPDVGGWRTTSAQGLVLARWAAAEVAAQRVDGLAWVAWILGALGVAAMGLSLPVDPGWPLVVVGALLLASALALRLALALVAALLRRLALPRRARHLRADAAAARGRLREVLDESGIPVSLGHALGFVWARVRGRRPHAEVVGELRGLTGRLVSAAEVAHLRTRLAQAAGASAEPGDDASPDGPGDQAAR